MVQITRRQRAVYLWSLARQRLRAGHQPLHARMSGIDLHGLAALKNGQILNRKPRLRGADALCSFLNLVEKLVGTASRPETQVHARLAKFRHHVDLLAALDHAKVERIGSDQWVSPIHQRFERPAEPNHLLDRIDAAFGVPAMGGTTADRDFDPQAALERAHNVETGRLA